MRSVASLKELRKFGFTLLASASDRCCTRMVRLPAEVGSLLWHDAASAPVDVAKLVHAHTCSRLFRRERVFLTIPSSLPASVPYFVFVKSRLLVHEITTIQHLEFYESFLIWQDTFFGK